MLMTVLSSLAYAGAYALWKPAFLFLFLNPHLNITCMYKYVATVDIDLKCIEVAII